MRLKVGNLHAVVEDVSVDEQLWLSEYLVFKERVFNPWKRVYEEKMTKLFNSVRCEFPSGYTRTVMEKGREAGFTVTVVDDRGPAPARDVTADLEWLRHHPAANIDPITHQMEAVEAVWKRTRGIIKVPTGGGKTEIACGIVKSLPIPWLFLVHRADLLTQTAERFVKRCPGEPAGLVGDGFFTTARFTVALYQSLHARLKRGDADTLALLHGVRGLLVDECHTLAAETFWDIAMQTPNAYYRVGLSGTPLQRGDKRSTFVVAALGPIIYRVSAPLLQQIGVLSRPSIHFQTVRQKAERPTWQGVYAENIMRSPVRNRAVLAMVKAAKKPCLVFVNQLNHGRLLEKMFRKTGIDTEFISGKEATHQRKAAVERLVRRDIEVLLVNVIFQEGVDIPDLESVVVATGGASPIASLQRIGRGMRATKTKTTFQVWEVADRGCGCTKKTKRDDPANYHAGCQWLDRHTNERIAAYEEEGYEVIIADENELFSQKRTGMKS